MTNNIDMNWYHSAKKKPPILVKKAQTFIQEKWEAQIGDYQRWVIDTFSCALFLTKTAKMVTISLNIWNWHNSTMMFQDFWKYGVKEEKKARSSFEKMKVAGQKVIDDYTKGERSEAPNCMIFTGMRKDFWNIDREHLAKTNIPHINYARQKADYENDWRSTLYGNRYPESPTTGF